jgi:hypothetical protein
LNLRERLCISCYKEGVSGYNSIRIHPGLICYRERVFGINVRVLSAEQELKTRNSRYCSVEIVNVIRDLEYEDQFGLDARRHTR